MNAVLRRNQHRQYALALGKWRSVVEYSWWQDAEHQLLEEKRNRVVKAVVQRLHSVETSIAFHQWRDTVHRSLKRSGHLRHLQGAMKRLQLQRESRAMLQWQAWLAESLKTEEAARVSAAVASEKAAEHLGRKKRVVHRMICIVKKRCEVSGFVAWRHITEQCAAAAARTSQTSKVTRKVLRSLQHRQYALAWGKWVAEVGFSRRDEEEQRFAIHHLNAVVQRVVMFKESVAFQAWRRTGVDDKIVQATLTRMDRSFTRMRRGREARALHTWVAATRKAAAHLARTNRG